MPSPMPSASSMPSVSQQPSFQPTQYIYYPRWGDEGEVSSEQETCVRGSYYEITDERVRVANSKAEGFQNEVDSNWVYDTLEECCKEHFWWEIPACEASEGTGFGQGSEVTKKGAFVKYYPAAAENGNLYCLNDGEQPAYMTNDFDKWMFDTLEDCCTTGFSDSQVIDYCLTNSVVSDNSLNNKFTPPELRVTEPNGTCHQRKVQYRPSYAYDGAVTEMCVLAGREPKYMRDQSDIWLFASLEECCQQHFWWSMSSCTSTGGDQGEAGQTNSGTFLEKPFYPVFLQTQPECAGDGQQPDYMFNNDLYMFATVDECCNEYFMWADTGVCIANSVVVAIPNTST